MDARHADDVTDAALDRDLQAMLDVAASPALVARVRTRIANEPSPAPQWFGLWTIVSSAVAVAAVAIVAVAIGRGARTGEPSGLRALDSRSAAFSPWTAPDLNGRALARSAGSEAARAGGPPTPAVRRLPAHARAEPEILVDAREAAALRALIAGTRDGRIDLAAVASASTPSVMELPAVTDIEIPAIAIDPITSDPSAPEPGEEGVRQ